LLPAGCADAVHPHLHRSERPALAPRRASLRVLGATHHRQSSARPPSHSRGIVAGMLPISGSRSARRRSTRTAVRSFGKLATGVEVSDPSGDRRGLQSHSQLPAASGVTVQASASGSTVALQTARGIYGGYRVTLPDRPSLRVSGCPLLRGPARRKREFGGNALPCRFPPRSPWCGYLAVADGRGRAHA
jgi:hypothetical protein